MNHFILLNPLMKLLLGGNWKAKAAEDAFEMISKLCPSDVEGLDAFVAVPTEHIARALTMFPTYIKIAAQNVSRCEPGPHTGETIAESLAAMGVAYIIVGHSERRTLNDETNAIVHEKLKCALRAKVRPVLCVGEPAGAKARGESAAYIKAQFTESIGTICDVSLDVAYEPIYAIGTGHAAEIEDVSRALSLIYDLMKKRNIQGRILYGGSVTADNIGKLRHAEHIGGFLVGSASLSDDFVKIAQGMTKWAQ